MFFSCGLSGHFNTKIRLEQFFLLCNSSLPPIVVYSSVFVVVYVCHLMEKVKCMKLHVVECMKGYDLGV